MILNLTPSLVTNRCVRLMLLLVGTVLLQAGPAHADDQHHAASGLPHNIPNFCAAASLQSIRSGAWSDPATWSAGRVPSGNDVVNVAAGTTVTYDVQSDASIACVGVNGQLVFRHDTSTRLTVGVLMVMATGELHVGHAGAPISSGVTAEIVIADRALDYLADPEQFGTGFIAFGKVRMHGAVRSPTYVRLTQEVAAGASALALGQSPSGWSAGDQLVLPDSRHVRVDQRDDAYVPRWETKTLSAISGTSALLSSSALYAHPGARNADSVLEFLPHVANLTRNVVIRSQNSNGVRGHVLFTGRADIDIRFAGFYNLGRTTLAILDSTTLDAVNNPTHIGTNQIGRYPLHLHHLMGPIGGQPGGYQYVLVGNAVDNSPKWGITLHNTHYGYVADNVVYRAQGAGIMTEDGSESYNVIERNFVVATVGFRVWAVERAHLAPPDFGIDGSAFWFRGTNNYVRNNVATSATMYGYVVAPYQLGNVNVPTAPGASTTIVMNSNATPLLDFSDNEAYGAIDGGLTLWWVGSYGNHAQEMPNDNVIRNLRVWHHHRHGFYGYPTNRLVIAGFVARGDMSVLSNPHDGSLGMWFGDYTSRDVFITGADIQGLSLGIFAPVRTDGILPSFIEDSYLRNYTNIEIQTMWDSGGATFVNQRTLVIRNVRFRSLPASTVVTATHPPSAINMDYSPQDGVNLIQPDRVMVYRFNGVDGDNFSVFYPEQAAKFVVPQSNSTKSIIGTPVAGLTNALSWAFQGVAVAGGVAPCENTRSEIIGFACFLGGPEPTRSAPPAPAPIPPPPPDLPPTPAIISTPVSTCLTPDPFAAMGGGSCWNGGWLPPGMLPPGSSASPVAAPPSATLPVQSSVGCSTPNPFVSMGGGTCYNGGWLPPGMVPPNSAQSRRRPHPHHRRYCRLRVPCRRAAPAAARRTRLPRWVEARATTAAGCRPVWYRRTRRQCAPSAPTSPSILPSASPVPASSAGCSTPNPFAAMGGGTCYNGGWLPPGMTPPNSAPVAAPSAPTSPSIIAVRESRAGEQRRLQRRRTRLSRWVEAPATTAAGCRPAWCRRAWAQRLMRSRQHRQPPVRRAPRDAQAAIRSRRWAAARATTAAGCRPVWYRRARRHRRRRWFPSPHPLAIPA